MAIKKRKFEDGDIVIGNERAHVYLVTCTGYKGTCSYNDDGVFCVDGYTVRESEFDLFSTKRKGKIKIVPSIIKYTNGF